MMLVMLKVDDDMFVQVDLLINKLKEKDNEKRFYTFVMYNIHATL